MLKRCKAIILRALGTERFVAITKNIMTLITGNGIAMGIGFFSSALQIRLLGLTVFGQATLIITYVQVIDSIFNFQSWQALIKFGAAYKNDPRQLKPYVKEAFIIDASTAIAGTAISILLVDLICGGFLKWNSTMLFLAKFYSMTTLFHIEGMPIGYLRIVDKYKEMSACTVGVSIIKFSLVIFVYNIRSDIYACIFLNAIVDILSYIFQFIIALYYLHKNQILEGIIKCKMPKLKSFFEFSIYTSIASTLDIPIKQLDVFIVSKVLSVEAVAVQKTFNTLLSMFNSICTPISHVFLPSFSEQLAANNIDESISDVKKVKKIILIIGIPTAIVLGLTSPLWLTLLYSQEVASYWCVFLIEAVLRVFSLSFIAIHPLFTAMGFVKKNISIMLISNVIYFISAIILGINFGLYGLAIAYAAQLLIVVVMKSHYIRNRVLSMR